MHFCAYTEAVAAHNAKRLHDTGAVAVPLRAVHEGGTGAAAGKEDDYMGLADHTRLAVDARVMLRQNLCTRFGLTNGSMGTVVAIVYSSDEHPSRGDLPQAVVVDFDHYTGPGLTDGTRHVAVPVSVARGQSGSLMRCTRTQIPLILGYATTIHKAQGCTVGAGESVEYMTVDLGQKEYAVSQHVFLNTAAQ